jgi:hypothetical protein
VATRTLPNTATPRFNFSPFSGPVPRRAVIQYKRAHRAWWSRYRQVTTALGSGFLILLLGGSLLGMVAIELSIVRDEGSAEDAVGLAVGGGVTLGFFVLVGWLFIWILRREVRFGPGWTRMTRLDAFARLNSMTYEFERRDVRYNGAIFSLGTKAVASDVLTVTTGRGIQIGNYRSFARSTFNTARFHGGYVVIELDRRMPHMIAIAKRKRKLFGNQSVAPGILRSQILSLEGDFDKYFTLYAPRQYERDALYVFTPDLMVLLIDRLASYDLEIVDNRLYIYSHKTFDMLDPQTHERLASIVQVVGHKAANQTRGYADDRMAPYSDMVAPGGLRLRRGITAGVVLAVIYIALRVLLTFHGV